MMPNLIVPDWPAPAQVKAFATERGDGASSGAYAGFNLGTHVDDVPEAVAENRRALRAALALPAEPSWLEQIHGADVVDLDTDEPGAVDAAVTSSTGKVCIVLTADCLPVLFSTQTGDRIGVAHAGWRGLESGVLPAMVAAMGVAPDDLLAWLGPAISAVSYEVGDDVRDAFLATDPGADGCFAPNERNRWQADLYGLARRSLAAAGVAAIYGGDFCTFREKDRFFSHRREAPCGRQATLIWRSSA